MIWIPKGDYSSSSCQAVRVGIKGEGLTSSIDGNVVYMYGWVARGFGVALCGMDAIN